MNSIYQFKFSLNKLKMYANLQVNPTHGYIMAPPMTTKHEIEIERKDNLDSAKISPTMH
jgi:hypothetical protein